MPGMAQIQAAFLASECWVCAPCLPYFLSPAVFAPWQDHSLQILAQGPGPALCLGVLIMACACPQ